MDPDNPYLLLHQLLYVVFSVVLVIVFVLQLSLYAYYKHHNSPLTRRFGVIQRTIHWCSLGGSFVFAFKSIDPIGAHGYFSIPLLYLVQDFCSYFILIAVFTTIFEACCACYHQLDLYSESGGQSLTPKILAYALVILWSAVCVSIFTFDILILQKKDTLWRGCIYYCYGVTFTTVTLLLQWVGADLNNNFHRLIPAMFTEPKTGLGQVALFFLGAVSSTVPETPKKRKPASSGVGSQMSGGPEEIEERIDIDSDTTPKSPTREYSKSKSTKSTKPSLRSSSSSSATPAVLGPEEVAFRCDLVVGEEGGAGGGFEKRILPESPSQLDPILDRLYQKFIRFLIFRRVAQVLSLMAVILLIFYGTQVIFVNSETTLPKEGDYNLEDDALCWLQALGIILGIWYSWVPVDCRRMGVETDSLVASSSIQREGLLSDHGTHYHTNTTAEDVE